MEIFDLRYILQNQSHSETKYCMKRATITGLEIRPKGKAIFIQALRVYLRISNSYQGQTKDLLLSGICLVYFVRKVMRAKVAWPWNTCHFIGHKGHCQKHKGHDPSMAFPQFQPCYHSSDEVLKLLRVVFPPIPPHSRFWTIFQSSTVQTQIMTSKGPE